MIVIMVIIDILQCIDGDENDTLWRGSWIWYDLLVWCNISVVMNMIQYFSYDKYDTIYKRHWLGYNIFVVRNKIQYISSYEYRDILLVVLNMILYVGGHKYDKTYWGWCIWYNITLWLVLTSHPWSVIHSLQDDSFTL